MLIDDCSYNFEEDVSVEDVASDGTEKEQVRYTNPIILSNNVSSAI
jgi:hypothetical protein